MEIEVRFGFLFSAICASTLLVAGCATTPGGLKANPENHRQFSSSENYQEVFRRIVESHRECRRKPLLPIGQIISDAQLYPELKRGTFTVGASGVGSQYSEMVEVSEGVNGGTVVDLYLAGSRDFLANRYKRWAAGDRSCSP